MAVAMYVGAVPPLGAMQVGAVVADLGMLPVNSGTASIVSYNASEIVLTATDATNGTTPYTYQWQRNEDGGTYSDLTNGSGVSGATTLDLTDGSVASGIVYRYRLVYTDSSDPPGTDTSNVVVASLLVAGVASFVSSGPDAIILAATDATDGTSPYTYQWQRNEDGGSYTDLTDGGGVSGSTTLDLTDGSVAEDILYRYKLVYSDSAETPMTDTSNIVAAQVYMGGALTTGGIVCGARSRLVNAGG